MRTLRPHLILAFPTFLVLPLSKSQDDPLVSFVQGLVTPSKTTVNASGIKVSTVSGQVSTDSINKSIPSPDKGQREGKAPMIIEEAPKIAKYEELNEEQKQRRAQVQFEAQHYTYEDWDLITEKIEANAELSKSVLGSGLQGEDFAKKLVELGTWKLSHLKNLCFEEVKEEFDKLVKQVESWAPINFEATKDSLKRFGEELQTKTSKRLKSDEEKDDESTKKTGKRRKQIARKGLHSDKTDEDESKDSKDDDPISGTNIPINPVPVAIKPPSIATYKIIKQGEKGVYQIVREDGTDIVYINFGAMLKDITRDDLTELYRIVMNRYGVNGPEDELEKVLWGYLKNMFEEPLSTDPIWSLLGQQRIISWRYYTTCRVHCLNLESSDIYMLTERKYPLTAEKEDEIFISQDKYVAEILKKFNYTDVKTASTLVDLEKPLVKDEDADNVDVHIPSYSKDITSLSFAYTDSDYAGATQDRKSTTRESKTSRHVKRGRDTKIPQSSGTPVKVGDETVHKELGDRIERATTTASSLEAEQDSGNINKTQSMATLNEPNP
ncbi:hypothetical protein Tco_1137497 [Tanacetum coccineum]